MTRWVYGGEGKFFQYCTFHNTVNLPCVIRKCGLFTFNCTEWNKLATCPACVVLPLIRYLLFPPMRTCRVTLTSLHDSYPTGLDDSSSLSNTIVTLALLTPAWPCLYTNSDKFPARTCERLVIPKTKHIESRMLDLPDPFRPVIALKWGSKLCTWYYYL